MLALCALSGHAAVADDWPSRTVKIIVPFGAGATPDIIARIIAEKLQQTLNQIEDSVQNARRYYNAVVRDFNTKIAQFPSNILANMFGFKPREFFEISAPAEREVPKVSFGAASS